MADARPSFGTYITLGTCAYRAGDTKLGEQARKDALAEASDSTTKQQVNQQLEQAEAQGKAIAKSVEGGRARARSSSRTRSAASAAPAPPCPAAAASPDRRTAPRYHPAPRAISSAGRAGDS